MHDAFDRNPPGNHPPIRVGLIGVTGYALAYFEELMKLVEAGYVAWTAVTIINEDDAPDQVAYFRSAGIPIYRDYRAMLEAERENLDWVCVPTAIGWHTRMTVDTLSMGIPVLLEKPIAPVLQDVETIQAAERKAGLPVVIGFQHNYAESTWTIKERFLNGVIGEIESIDSLCLWPRPRNYYQRNDWGGRLYLKDSWVLDSPLHNAISHVVNLILFLSGSTMETRADILSVKAELYRAKPIQSYDTIYSEVQLDTGPKARVVLSHSAKTAIDPVIRFTGSKGVFVWHFAGRHTLTIDGKTETLPPEDQLVVRERMFRNVVRLLQGQESVHVCSTEQAKGEVKWVNAVQDAAPINDVPAQYLSSMETPSGEVLDIIEGVDTFAQRAFDQQCGFHELGAPWAVEPSFLDLKDYTGFRATHIPAPSTPVSLPVV